MPRGKTPSLIGASNGRPKKVIVQRKSKCNRCGGDIHIGDDCYNIPKTGNSFSKETRYCIECYKNILVQTEQDLAALKKEINVSD